MALERRAGRALGGRWRQPRLRPSAPICACRTLDLDILPQGGNTDLVLGLEVVLADGSVWEGLSTLRKDNRGIDLKQLFIGAEGTLGIITAVAVKLSPLPEQMETALLSVADLHAAIALYRHARRACCDLISAFEFMPPSAFTLAREAQPDLPLPIDTAYPAYVLIEISSSGLIDAKQLMEGSPERAMEEALGLTDPPAPARSAQTDDRPRAPPQPWLPAGHAEQSIDAVGVTGAALGGADHPADGLGVGGIEAAGAEYLLGAALELQGEREGPAPRTP